MKVNGKLFLRVCPKCEFMWHGEESLEEWMADTARSGVVEHRKVFVPAQEKEENGLRPYDCFTVVVQERVHAGCGGKMSTEGKLMPGSTRTLHAAHVAHLPSLV